MSLGKFKLIHSKIVQRKLQDSFSRQHSAGCASYYKFRLSSKYCSPILQIRNLRCFFKLIHLIVVVAVAVAVVVVIILLVVVLVVLVVLVVVVLVEVVVLVVQVVLVVLVVVLV